MRLFPFGGQRRTTNADAVVTGAGSGIGRAFAVELGRRGGRVVCSDIDETARRRPPNWSSGGRQGDRHPLRCHRDRRGRRNWPPPRRTGSAARRPGDQQRRHRRGRTGRSASALDDWQRTLGVNLWGVIHGCHVFAPILRAAGRGRHHQRRLGGRFGAAPRMAAYNVSKAGVLSLSETLAAELAGTGVGVTVLCPTVREDQHHRRRTASTTPPQRLGGLLLRWTGLLRRPSRPHHASTRTTAASLYVRAAARGQDALAGTNDWLPDDLHPLRPACSERVVRRSTTEGDRTMAFDYRRDAADDRASSGRWPTSTGTHRVPRPSPTSSAPKLQAFMADLVLDRARRRPRLRRAGPPRRRPGRSREIYRYFHAEEQKHANAELALMKRWGMLADGDAMPEPNMNIRLAIRLARPLRRPAAPARARHRDPARWRPRSTAHW